MPSRARKDARHTVASADGRGYAWTLRVGPPQDVTFPDDGAINGTQRDATSYSGSGARWPAMVSCAISFLRSESISGSVRRFPQRSMSSM